MYTNHMYTCQLCGFMVCLPLCGNWDESLKLEIYDMPGHLIRRLNQVSASLFQEETSKAGYNLTPVQYAALGTVLKQPALDQATLASLIVYDRATIGGVVDRLVQKSLVRREISSRDRRARELYLTDEGERVYEHVTPIVIAMQNRITEGLDPEERKVFLKLLGKAVAAANEQNRDP